MTDVKNVIQGLERTDVKASCVQRELPASDTRNNNTVSEHEAVNFDEAFSAWQRSVNADYQMPFVDAKYDLER